SENLNIQFSTQKSSYLPNPPPADSTPNQSADHFPPKSQHINLQSILADLDGDTEFLAMLAENAVRELPAAANSLSDAAAAK
ncbi:MAG: hypothetical protein NZL93_05465, partial [Chthoniobacterales bacterium]|nr:hypothetical protein [Chthoniobacterales bacterium]